VRPNAQGILGDLNRIMLAQKDDPSIWGHKTYLTRSLDTADPWKTDIK
jgi:hypothetical protein